MGFLCVPLTLLRDDASADDCSRCRLTTIAAEAGDLWYNGFKAFDGLSEPKPEEKEQKKSQGTSGVLNVVGDPAVRHSSINVGCSSGTFKYDICSFCSPFLTVFFLFPSLDAATIRQPFGPFRNTAASFEADLNTTQCRRFSTSLYWFSPFAPCPTLSLYPSCFSFNFPDSTIFSVCALPQPVLFSCYCSY